MTTSSFTEADLRAVEMAIATGAEIVEHSDGKKIKYKSTNQLIAAADYIRSQLSGTRGYRKRTVRMTGDRETGVGYAGRYGERDY